LPRGCFVFDKIECVDRVGQSAPMLVHPFTIMEYWDNTAQFHDFVYASADTSEPGFRRELINFFEAYRKANGREGEYLISADITEPIWDAVFASPEEMRSRKAPQLRLIEARVRDTVNGEDVAYALIQELSQLHDIDDLRRMSADAAIPWQRWFTGGPIAEESIRLVDQAIRSGKQQALLQVILMERPL
jgi:hypothetical protein